VIEPDLLQAALIAHLRTDAALISTLPELADGVREAQWRGTSFQYPCVRVGRPSLGPYGNGTCSDRDSRATWEISALSKADSSITAQDLQGLVLGALEGRRLATADLRSLPIRPVLLSPVGPADSRLSIGTGGEAWMGRITFRTIVTKL